MTPEQKRLVKQSWEKVLPIKERAAELFYGRLFEQYPEVKPYFKGDMKEQGQKLMAMLNSAVNSLDDIDSLIEPLKKSGKAHVSYGVKAEDYDALVLPGGRAPEYLRLDEKVLRLVKHFITKDKPIAAICHAAQLLAAAGGVQGKTCSAYPAVGPDVNNAGGTWVDVPMDGAHVDGNLVTAPAWPAHPAWLAAFLKVLGTRIEP